MIIKAKDSLRGRVIQKWKDNGEPSWGYDRTLQECVKANGALESKRLNPALCFRSAIMLDDRVYIRQWVYGCHFSWLNPR